MKEAWNFDRCVSVLNDEIAILKELSATQDKVRRTAMSRKWADFDEKLQDANRLGGEFARLEGERTRLFSALSGISDGDSDGARGTGTGEKPFYTAIMALPPGERGELSRLYRELKMETLIMRALNETFLAYLNEAKNLAASYIEAVCPARGGKLYTRRGHRVSQDLKSIVLNNHF